MSKTRTLRFVRNVLISSGVVLVVIVGGGVAYTWYMGQDAATTTAAIAMPAAPEVAPSITPTKPAANAKESAAVRMLTSPVAPGQNASITVKSNADSKCTIKVEYDKVPSTDSGLKPKITDEFGIVNWTWTVPASAPLGKWPVDVMCVFNDQSAMVRGDLQVAKETP